MEECLNKQIPNLKGADAEEIGGYTIVLEALSAPLKQIAINAGLEAKADVIVNNVRENSDPNCGFDVVRGDYVNMLESGIVDPVKVTRSAIQNAASIASMILTTESLVTDVKEENSVPAAMPQPGMY